MYRASVATPFGIESAISSLSILRYHSLGFSREAMGVATQPSRASMILNGSAAFYVVTEVVMKPPTMSSSTVLHAFMRWW